MKKNITNPTTQFKLLVLLICLFAYNYCCSQTVDKVRLGYDSTKTISKQTGMAVSLNGKYLAFAFQDRTIKIFDVINNKKEEPHLFRSSLAINSRISPDPKRVDRRNFASFNPDHY